MSKAIASDLKREGYPAMMSVGEAETAMRCSNRTLWRRVESGGLKRYGSTRCALFRREDVARVIANGG